jgi:hypothetical protein
MSGGAEQFLSGNAWIQNILSSILLSAGVGGAISAFVNYWMNLNASKKRDEMRMVEDKLRMYALILYYLNELRTAFEAISAREGRPSEEDAILIRDVSNSGSRRNKNKDENDNEWNVVVKTIDAELREQPHLVDPHIHRKWVELKSLYFDERSKIIIPELRKMLMDKGNQIIEKYLKYIDQDIISGFSQRPSPSSWQIS